MNRRRRRIVDAGEEGRGAGLARDLVPADLAKGVQVAPCEHRENTAPRSDMTRAGRAPDPAVAAELGVNAMLDAELLDVARGFAEMVAQASGTIRAAEGFQGGELRPLRQDHAGIPAAGAAAADVGLDNRDVRRRRTPLDLDRGPQTGEAAADDADISLGIADQFRLIEFSRRDRL